MAFSYPRFILLNGEHEKSEKQIKAIDTMLSYIDKYEAAKPVHAEYATIGWKKKNQNENRKWMN